VAVEREQEFERVMARLWSSPDGVYVMNELVLRKSTRMFDSDPLKMAYKVGQLELLQYINSFVRRE
jgi:hypothetical protein